MNVIERHRAAAEEAYRHHDLDSARWHLDQIEQIRQRRQTPRDPEATAYLEEMLVAEELGIVQWRPEKGDWV